MLGKAVIVMRSENFSVIFPLSWVAIVSPCCIFWVLRSCELWVAVLDCQFVVPESEVIVAERASEGALSSANWDLAGMGFWRVMF